MLSHLKLTSVAEGFKVSAISSVVTGKEIEAEILSLQNDLEGNALRFTLKAYNGLVYIIFENVLIQSYRIDLISVWKNWMCMFSKIIYTK